MTVGKLKTLLDSFEDDREIMILENGHPREINSGPYPREVESIDADYTCDCEHLVGQHVVVLGFGSY